MKWQGRDMRKAQKRQIEETIKQMEKAHDEIKKCISQGNFVQAGELLADCQNAAVAIGTLIEATEGEGHPAVTVLEEYCELVYQNHEGLSLYSSVNTVNVNKIYRSLRQKLIKALNSIRNDIKIRTEAVFLPYMASMWDSLESVWKAADADPDCDAYVIPIPYFNKNPDGSFKEEHYEGDGFPDYVPVTRYDVFDFQKHMPDVIYIHNGYDDWNLVTSVHPNFYSRNLNKYTEELVYIPYFVLGEIDTDNKQAAEGIKHFCFMPGIINANKVIVQSENMKKIYVREYLKAAKEYGLTGKHLDKTYLETKFLGTGSPKYDKVLNTKKEDLEIPENWLKIIQKPDGIWKRIIFYNTSIAGLLQHNEKMLEKMKYVFRIFKENQEEVALLWRPHPLIKATVESMRPQLFAEYEKLLKQYKEEGWGIYDDTADVDRAIEISDAYYGDRSSVVQLYQKTGKPMMTQNCALKDGASQEYLPFDGGTYYDKKIWCVCSEDNTLYTINVENAEINHVCDLGGEEEEGSRLYLRTFFYKGMIYLTPCYSKNFAVFDTVTKKKKVYECEGLSDVSHKFYSIASYKDAIYVFPLYEDCILRYDIQTKQINCLREMMLQGIEAEQYKQRGYFTKRNVILGNIVIIPSAFTNKVFVMDMDTQKFSWKVIHGTSGGFADIEIWNDDIYLLDNEMRILKTDLAFEKNAEKIYQFREKYGYMIMCSNQFAMIPKYDNKIALFDVRQLKVKFLEYPVNHKFYEEAVINHQVMFSEIVILKKEIYLIPRNSNMLVKIQRDTLVTDYVPWSISKKTLEFLQERVKERLRSDKTVFESKEGIRALLSIISENKTDRTDNGQKEQCGKTIYKNICLNKW